MTEFANPVVGGSDGQAYRFLDTLAYVRVPSSATNGDMSIVEMHVREGHAPPMHVHKDADETIHVIDGRVTAQTPTESHTVAAGESVVLPRGEEHSLVADTQAELIVTTSPGGFDEFVTTVGEPTDEISVPAEPPGEAAVGRVTEHAPAHDIEIVGPPPGHE